MVTKGGNFKWTLDTIKKGLDRYFAENNRFPTSTEFDECAYLPSTRQIQRRFGGLPLIRSQLGLSGPIDFTSGEYSSTRARNINVRANKLERIVYDFLVKKYGKPFVHREYFFTDDRRVRIDFFIYWKGGNIAVDVFFPKDRHNLLGCLNSKLRTYKTDQLIKYPVIFLMMNDDISIEEIRGVVSNKINKLKSNQSIMTYRQFQEYCKDKDPVK